MVRGNDNEYQLVLFKGGDQEPAPNADQNQQNTQVYTRSKYVGLANQGATCYMNSLLQSLFMTKAFRREIYLWNYDPLKEVERQDCITFQLQVLFGKLQLLQSTEKQYVETTDLTKSFGWDIRESFQQHDVQEFCRVLFDAIEQSCKDTLQGNIINQLYQGTFQDYVKCLECQHESQREDKFLDISLTVRNDFDKIYNSSLQQALENYTKPEKLDKENMYFCEICNKKVEALKGLKFLNFPPILCLQLKRFDLDYQTMMRKKLNDYVSFPQILNMNRYQPESLELRRNESLSQPQVQEAQYQYQEQGQEEQKQEEMNHHIQEDEKNHEELKTDQDCDSKADEEYRGGSNNFQTKQKPQVPKKSKEQLRREREIEIESALQEGTNVYELYSIMIHSGSALGGHYYAYIKDFDIDQWYSFNDSYVSAIDESEIEKAFGGTQQGYYWGGSNAYLLMYRKIGYDANYEIDNSQVPPHVRDVLEQDRQRQQQEEEERREKMNNIQLKVYYKGNDKLIPIKKTNTLQELKSLTLQEFQIKEQIQEQNCRIRGYSSHYEMMQEVFENENQTLDDLKFYNYRTLALETKQENESFEDYNSQDVHFKAIVWQEQQEISPNQSRGNQYIISFSRDKTLDELLDKFESLFNIPKNKIQLIRKYNTYNSYNIETMISNQTDLARKILHCKIYEGMILYVEEIEEGKDLKWKKEFDREQNKVIVKFNNPKNPKVDNYGFIEYNGELIIYKQQQLNELRTMLSKQMEIEEDSFIIKRGGKHGTEIKDMSQTIQQCFMNINQFSLYIEFGKPTKLGECRVAVWHAALKEDSEQDIPSHLLTELFELPCMENVPITEIKKLIVAEHNQKREKETDYKEKFPEFQFIRLREKIADRLGKVLKNSSTLMQVYAYEKKNIVLEVLQQEENIDNDSFLCYAKHFSPST